MAEPRYAHSLTPEELVNLLLYQANQFELFKDFIIDLLDLKNVIKINEFHELFKEYKELNKTKLLHNLIMLRPTLGDTKLDLTLL